MFRYLVSLLASRGLPLEHKADDILHVSTLRYLDVRFGQLKWKM